MNFASRVDKLNVTQSDGKCQATASTRSCKYRFEKVESSGDICHMRCGNQTQIVWKEMTFVGK